MPRAQAFECPACGAAVHFKPGSAQVVCDFCGSEFSVDQIPDLTEPQPGQGAAGGEAESLIASANESIARAEAALASANRTLGQGDAEAGDDGATKKVGHSYREIEGTQLHWEPFLHALEIREFEDTKVYTCVNCGAELVTEATTVATTCPYCDSNVVINEKLSSGLRPNGVIPFAFPASELPARLQEFYKDRPLLPKDYFSAAKMENIMGVYVPFWLFNGTVEANITYGAETVAVFTDGKDEVTETSHYQLERGGSVSFERIPVDGSERMEDDLMDSIEPFDYSGVVPFNTAYLSGFYADRFDNEPLQVLSRADVRLVNSTREVFEETCGGYGAVHTTDEQMDLAAASVEYMLLPVYLFNTSYNGVKYRYAINGQTGKVVGDVPTDKGRLWRARLIPGVVAAAVFFALNVFLMM